MEKECPKLYENRANEIRMKEKNNLVEREM